FFIIFLFYLSYVTASTGIYSLSLHDALPIWFYSLPNSGASASPLSPCIGYASEQRKLIGAVSSAGRHGWLGRGRTQVVCHRRYCRRFTPLARRAAAARALRPRLQ